MVTPVVSEMHYYSVLIRGVTSESGEKSVEEIYRVKLPGNPVLGEGECRELSRGRGLALPHSPCDVGEPMAIEGVT
jgi:hypothetical protein